MGHTMRWDTGWDRMRWDKGWDKRESDRVSAHMSNQVCPAYWSLVKAMDWYHSQYWSYWCSAICSSRIQPLMTQNSWSLYHKTLRMSTDTNKTRLMTPIMMTSAMKSVRKCNLCIYLLIEVWPAQPVVDLWCLINESNLWSTHLLCFRCCWVHAIYTTLVLQLETTWRGPIDLLGAVKAAVKDFLDDDKMMNKLGRVHSTVLARWALRLYLDTGAGSILYTPSKSVLWWNLV